MSPTEPTPITLIEQSCKYGETKQPNVPGINAGMNLRTQMEWTYEFILFKHERYNFDCYVNYENIIPNQEQFETLKQFQVVEARNGNERILEIYSTNNNCSMELIEVIPINAQKNEIDYKLLKVSSSKRTISFAESTELVFLKVSILHLNILKYENARAFVKAKGNSVPIHFYESIVPLIDLSEYIHIDKLDNLHSGKRVLQEYLSVLFNILFGEDSDRMFSLQCNYEYHPGSIENTISLPVLLLTNEIYSQENAAQILYNLSSAWKNWFLTYSPMPGTFIFNISVYNKDKSKPVPMLRLRSLILPVDSIADLTS